MSGIEESQDSAIREFQESVLAVLGDRLKELWLFGSRARGDNQQDSDYDFLVVAEGQLEELRALIADKENDIMFRRGDILSSIVYTPHLWARARNAPLGLNIRREGKRIS